MIPFPTGQGFIPSMKNAEIDVGGSRVIGVKSLSWDESCEGEIEYGNGVEPLGVTIGEYAATVEIEQLLSEYMVLRMKIGGREKGFNCGFQVTDPSIGVISITIPSIRLASNAGSWSGKPGTTVKYKGQVMKMIEINGLTIVQRFLSPVGLSIGAVSQVTTGLASVGAAVSLPI
jgi:hypothetical protein